MKHIVNLSGGKDSTAMLLIMLEKQIPIDYIVFADTGKDFPQMIEHLKELENYIQIKYPDAPKITYLKADKTFEYMMFEHEKTKGKNKGKKGYGWCGGKCRWGTTEKLKALDTYCEKNNAKCYIGIASDEIKRINKEKKLYKLLPLVEWRY